jgi:hypothetical protein
MENVSPFTELSRNVTCAQFTLPLRRHAEHRHHIPKRRYRVTGHPTQSPTADPCTALPVRRPKPSSR